MYLCEYNDHMGFETMLGRSFYAFNSSREIANS
jgi:hypothetical protein